MRAASTWLLRLRQQIGEQNIKHRGDEQAAANAETRTIKNP